MEWFVRAIITGITAFVATNIDDIVVLMLFFAKSNDEFRPKHIIAGQYLGFAALLLMCLPGLIGGAVLPKPWVGLLGFLPIAIGSKYILDSNKDELAVQTISEDVATNRSKWTSVLHPKIYQVAVVTLANSGDNIGVYVPLFAGSSLPSVGVIVSVFLVLVALWCWIASYLASRPKVAPLLTHSSHRIIPFVLIGLGLYILIESGSYSLLPWVSIPR